MHEITESQAQELANLLRQWVAVDEDGGVIGYVERPVECFDCWDYAEEETHHDYLRLPIRVISTRPWTEQIWGPQG